MSQEFLTLNRAPLAERRLEQQLHKEYAEEKEFSSRIKAYLKANGVPVRES